MKAIKINTPVNPDGIDLVYTVMVDCGKEQVQFSILAEYELPEHGDQTIAYRTCVTANAMEALPNGYDQFEVTAQVELQANYWTPTQMDFKPAYPIAANQ
ncbi:hypothetical protein HDF24_04480 [Mucilaginibacter sp. X4EP1]|uniref:hypothetical protein n=1 Tax=Mucilaginibacter sp. X4EP1 TaxID=2723092 RepID=UPI002168D93E|nr:hypothetical protein [Mucilaginibacter sp. X4EP1]MCS3816246.1 hypothetical protein [Mucilaginibacter sp. X4EP1]